MRSKKAIGQNATRPTSGGCARWAHDHVGDAAEAVEREGRGLWGKTGQRSLERSALPSVACEKAGNEGPLAADCVAKLESCSGKILGENLKRKEVDDSHSLGRASEVAHEFGARR
jgi:hypothetical protein